MNTAISLLLFIVLDYELTKSKLNVEDDELLASENITGFSVSNSAFTKLNKHRKKLTPEEIEARNKKVSFTSFIIIVIIT